MSAGTFPAVFQDEVQGLALTGFNDRCVRHLLLRVSDADLTRQFIGELVKLLAFGEKARRDRSGTCAINVGFSYEGLYVLGAPKFILEVLKERSPAFGDGAVRRAGRYLGDGGRSAPDLWEPAFFPQEPQVWIAIHGPTQTDIRQVVDELRAFNSSFGLAGWDEHTGLCGEHIEDSNSPTRIRRVPFGFRDSITRPRIDDSPDSPPAGELLLGYKNIDKVDLWTDEQTTRAAIGEFLRHGSFGVLRKIEQFEDEFNAYLDDQVRQLRDTFPHVSVDYLKAKFCGRWPNGAPVLPGQWTEPAPPANEDELKIPNFKADPDGLGCPFGAHIRRANPRDDKLVPEDLKIHTLFRRGVPYQAGGERGLLGVFFCARIEDQFERIISEWFEKKPMGPPNRGRAKDPLAGNHDDPDCAFIIPQKPGPTMELKGFFPFIRTKGTLYALFPSHGALRAMVEWGSGPDTGAEAETTEARAAQQPPMQSLAGGPAGTAAAVQDEQDESATEEEDEDEPSFMDVPSDRFCDVVMEGGITSGVIYASAAAELGRHYRFRNIGGSSIGAFAAALTAGAEYRRRKGSGDGFDLLESLPRELAQTKDERTLLERLFIPQKTTRRLFAIFLASLERENTLSLLWHGLRAAQKQYAKLLWWTMAALLLLTLAGPALSLLGCPGFWTCTFGFSAWGLAALLAVVVAFCGALVAGIVWDLIHGLVPNGFGLCRGWNPKGNSTTVDLAGYLHASIQRVAGRHARDEPLTFEDLWNAPGPPAQALDYTVYSPAAARSINLEVYSSNLAHSRPYRFPLEETEDMGRLFFRVEDLEDYFPKRIVRYVQGYAKEYTARSSADPSAQSIGKGYLELPVAKLPVVVAVRMAMSFPVLISAVPLYAIDHERQSMERCWMSDGGLCSNFPIHLFDSFIPKWPTFGISLQERQKETRKPVVLPEFHTSGRGECWDRGTTEATSGLGKLGGFLLSLWKTTWRWNDSTMMRMPGVRDRVVRVYLGKKEGGVNIRMKADKIEHLGRDYGKAAAAEFIRKFATPDSKGWQEHRWVRFNCMLLSLRAKIQGISDASGLDRHTTPLEEQIDRAKTDPPLRKPPRRTRIWPSEDKLKPEQIRELKAQLEALCALEEVLECAGDSKPYRAVPQSSMRIRHPT